MKVFVYLFLLLFSVGNIFSATENITLSGNYYGRNLIVINPLFGESFSVQSVYVNNKQSSDEIASSVFEIDFAAIGIGIGAEVSVTIEFNASGPKPTIYNPEVLKSESNFSFTRAIIDKKTNKITWAISGSPGEEPFEIEQYRWDKWVRIGTVLPNDSFSINEYNCAFVAHSGKNLFRVKLIDCNGNTVYSPSIKYQSKTPEVMLINNKVTERIEMSDETMYQLYDEKGNLLLHGTAAFVDVAGLEKGKYWLNFDNKTQEILKK